MKYAHLVFCMCHRKFNMKPSILGDHLCSITSQGNPLLKINAVKRARAKTLFFQFCTPISTSLPTKENSNNL